MPIYPHSRKALQTTPSKGFSVWQSVFVPIAILVVLFVILEFLARSSAAQRVFPMRSYGNYHTQFEIKWQKLEKYVHENGGVDVILLGNSMVNTGIDPEVFVKYLSGTNSENLRVFNFGVEGLTIVPMVDLTRLLIDTYHPGTIIYYTELRDFIAGNGDDVAETFLSNKWLQYRLGQISITGWIVDHSLALQSFLSWRYWAKSDFFDDYLNNLQRWKNTRLDGYEPEIWITSFTGEFPDPGNPKDMEMYALYGNFTIDPARLESLKTLLAFEQSGTKIWITEFPAYPGFYEYFGGQQVYEEYLLAIREHISEQGGVFIPPINPDLIPLLGRFDDHHVNFLGANIYSGLQARQLARICQDENLCLARR